MEGEVGWDCLSLPSCPIHGMPVHKMHCSHVVYTLFNSVFTLVHYYRFLMRTNEKVKVTKIQKLQSF
jgi:hypothetical protein